MSTLPYIGSKFRALAFASVFFTFALVVIGGIVRLTGSGMGCPDWPLCQGQLIPPLEYHTLIEYVHRLVALLVALTVLGIAVVAFMKYRAQRRILILAGLVIVLYLFQAVLGGITVLTANAPWTVSLHLGNALLLFAAILVLATLGVAYARRAKTTPSANNSARRAAFVRMALLNAAGVFFLVLSGSYVVAIGASGACVAWPLCDNNLIPANVLQWIHMAHRIIAGLIGIFLIVTCVQAQRLGNATGRTGTWLLWIFIAQILVGGANVLLGFPLALNAFHLALATAVWGLAVILVTVAQIETGTGWIGAYAK